MMGQMIVALLLGLSVCTQQPTGAEARPKPGEPLEELNQADTSLFPRMPPAPELSMDPDDYSLPGDKFEQVSYQSRQWMMLGLGPIVVRRIANPAQRSCPTAMLTEVTGGCCPSPDVERAHAVRPTPCQVGGRAEQAIHQHGAIFPPWHGI